MAKKGKGGGGNSHDRNVESTKTLSANSGGEKKPPPISGNINSSGGSPSESNHEQLSAKERALVFLENVWTLMVIGAVVAFAGVFIDGRYFILGCIPVLLGLHRSGALKGLNRRKLIITCAVVFFVSFGLLWMLGAATNKHREHIPSANEIADAVAKKISALLRNSNQPAGGVIVTRTAFSKTESLRQLGGKTEINLDNLARLTLSVPSDENVVTLLLDGIVSSLPDKKSPTMEVTGISVVTGYSKSITFDRFKNNRQEITVEGRTFVVTLVEINTIDKPADLRWSKEYIFGVSEK